MKTVHALWRLLTSGEDEDKVLDHVPISGKRDYRKRIARALERHGKPFRAHTKVQRVERPSRTLQELDQLSKDAAPPENVSQISKRTK